MAARRATHRCESCGVGGTLVQFGDAGAYRYHCLSCWKQRAADVAIEYAERYLSPASETSP